MSAAQPTKLPRLLAWLVAAIGVIMLVAGLAVYGVTSAQLRSQDIKVAAVSADAPGAMAGKQVAGPFTALAQINAIKHHTATATGGKTYAELPNVATSDGLTYNTDLTAEKSTDGQSHVKGDPLSAADAKSYSSRALAQQSSFLQASLLLSVLAFGVAAFIAGTGLTVLIIGLALLALLGAAARQKVVEKAEIRTKE